MNEMTIERAIAVNRNASECGYGELESREYGWYADRLEELKAYRSTGYTPEQIRELHDKHWNECRQIAHYDNEVKMLYDQVAHLKGILDRPCGCPSDCSD